MAISDMTALLCGSSQTHVGTSMPSGGGHIIRADECLNEEIFDTLADARQKMALWRYYYNNITPHSSHGNKTPAETRRVLEINDGTASGALAQPEIDDYLQARLSL